MDWCRHFARFGLLLLGLSLFPVTASAGPVEPVFSLAKKEKPAVVETVPP